MMGTHVLEHSVLRVGGVLGLANGSSSIGKKKTPPGQIALDISSAPCVGLTQLAFKC